MSVSRFLYRLVFSCTVLTAQAQNLVPNGDFETHDACPSESAQYYLLSHWQSASEATPDLLCECASEQSLVNTAKNFAGSQAPRSGSCYAGFLAWHSDEYYEYLVVKLSQPLQKNKKYLLTFYYTISDYSDKKTAQLGVQFKQEKTTVPGYAQITEPAINDSIVNNLRLWKPFQVIYTAAGDETYLNIGCFTQGVERNYSDKVPDGYGPSPGDHFAYYYIDDVSLEPYKGQPLLKEPAGKRPAPATAYVPPVIYFDTDKSTLQPEGKAALEKLAVWLKQNPSAIISLSGHTDNSGNDGRNSPLGMQRATAVKNFLVQKGIAVKRMSISGNSSAKPAASNDTEAGKQKNRRVEIRIVRP